MNHPRRFVRLGAVAVIAAVLAASATGVAGAAPREVGGRPDRAARPEIPKDPRWATPPGYDEQPGDAGSTGDGRNDLQFGAFDDGDIVVAIESLSVGHAGEWDDRYYSSVYSQCVWSAVKSSLGCVVREAPLKYRTYDRAYGLWVPSVSDAARIACRNYCVAQIGEPYNISSSKTDQSKWYCSKLVWASYKYKASKDLDANGGYWVAPVDLYNDNDTSVFVASN